MRRAAIGQPPSVPGDPLLRWIVNALHEVARASHVDTAESIAATVGAGYQPLSANLTDWSAVNPSAYSTSAQIAAAYQPIGSYQPLDSDLTAIAALTTTTYGRSLLESVSAAALFASIKQAASETATGAVELATTTEAQTGTDTSRAVTPAGLRSATRELLLANRTYYVRTDGSDSNTGLVNNAGGAFLTVQKAFDTICALDLGGFTATISVQSGTHTGALNVDKPWVGGNIVISGSSVIWSVTSAHAVFVSASYSGLLTISTGITIQTTTGGDCLRVAAPCNLNFACNFGACAGAHVNAAASGAVITGAGSYTVSGGAVRHWYAQNSGSIQCQSKTITITGTPAFTRFAEATIGGNMTVNGNTFSGSATGTRYLASVNGVIATGSGGASYLPGDVAGSTSTGGQYA